MKLLNDVEYEKFVKYTVKELDKSFIKMLNKMSMTLLNRKLTEDELDIALTLVSDKGVLRVDEMVLASVKLAKDLYGEED